MSSFFDDLETQSADQRAQRLAQLLPDQIDRAQGLPGYADTLGGVDASAVRSPADLAALPVLRKAELGAAQKASGPLGGLTALPASGFAHVFQSPGPIYEPGGVSHDWWRMGRFLAACGIGAGDIVQNCFGYHLTPAGMIFENGARAVGGGALFPSLRQEYADRGIACLQCYATADLGNIAYESAAMEGLIVDEGVIVEIVTPGTGDPVAPGEVGEVVVTTLNPDYPLIRFATGDLSAVMEGESSCGRTNLRIKGWMGRADQTTKIKGMFVRPEQVAALVARHDAIARARVVASREGEMDVMTVQIEADGGEADTYADAVSDVLKLKGRIEVVAKGSLPNDGKVIEDLRSYE